LKFCIEECAYLLSTRTKERSSQLAKLHKKVKSIRLEQQNDEISSVSIRFSRKKQYESYHYDGMGNTPLKSPFIRIRVMLTVCRFRPLLVDGSHFQMHSMNEIRIHCGWQLQSPSPSGSRAWSEEKTKRYRNGAVNAKLPKRIITFLTDIACNMIYNNTKFKQQKRTTGSCIKRHITYSKKYSLHWNWKEQIETKSCFKLSCLLLSFALSYIENKIKKSIAGHCRCPRQTRLLLMLEDHWKTPETRACCERSTLVVLQPCLQDTVECRYHECRGQ